MAFIVVAFFVDRLISDTTRKFDVRSGGRVEHGTQYHAIHYCDSRDHFLGQPGSLQSDCPLRRWIPVAAGRIDFTPLILILIIYFLQAFLVTTLYDYALVLKRSTLAGS
jgi:hypothetical protein